MHTYRTMTIGDNLIQNLVINETTSHSVEFAGSVDGDGDCTNAGSYSDPYGTFSNVRVTGYIAVSLKERYNAVTFETNKIRLESGTVCSFMDERCIDSIYGYAFWERVQKKACQSNKYTNLYSGPVKKITEVGSERRPLYVLDTDDISFAFKDMGRITQCGFELVKTEHPRLFN